MGSGVSRVSEALFIHCGMTKNKWPQITVPLIQGFLDDPTWLDAEDEDFVEDFFFYYEWYWREHGTSVDYSRTAGLR